MRLDDEFDEAILRLMDQVWLSRHQMLCSAVARGETRIVNRKTVYANDGDRFISRKTWENALKSATRTEKRLGRENLGPWSDFDVGMLNGKLSALRWAQGGEWDELYI